MKLIPSVPPITAPLAVAGLCLTFLMSPNGAMAQSGNTRAADDIKPRQVTVETADGVVVYGDLFERDADVTILLFHQGGSNVRGEYAPIIQRLLGEGYRVAAFDLRMGGQWYGSWNRTVADHPGAESYCDAAPDIKSVVEFARNRWPDSSLVLWGSSYSATLVIREAGSDPTGIGAVLSFSPASGDPMAGCRPEEFFERVTMPLFVLRPPSEAENPAVQEQLRLAEAAGHETFVPEHGVHGSSMLVSERVRADVEPTWARVLAFLAESTR